MSSTMTPAERVIEKCGGPETLARMAGVTPARVKRWTFPEHRGGTGGRIPSKHQQALLDAARESGIDLSPADFFDEAAQ